MLKIVSIICVSLSIIFNSDAQIRFDKLVLEAKEKYKIKESDILVVDTLIMKDSSALFIDPFKKDSFIHAKIASFGRGCQINGYGENGRSGNKGESGATSSSPCKNGLAGKNGFAGERGKDASNLSLYFTNMNVEGSLIINLNGGDGGVGGRGGSGGDGGSGTRVCQAGDGGHGGNGGNGGDGGNGGALSINCKQCFNLHLLMGNKIIVKNFGGFGGVGGDGGPGGQAGLGSKRDGKNGNAGTAGIHASQGKEGLVTISGI